MNKEKLIENLIEQIKEAQLKLGFVKETIRLYFPFRSLAGLLGIACENSQELQKLLENEFEDTVLGKLTFSTCKGDRIEVRIPASGAVYVKNEVPDPPFLSGIIDLFQQNHSLTISELCSFFAQFSSQYICKKMEPGTDFDYVLYFPDQQPDSWYYCVRLEMGHTIYHRFTEEDYRSL